MQYHGTVYSIVRMAIARVPYGTRPASHAMDTRVQILHYLKNNLKYKHSGATGTLVGVVSIEGITVPFGILPWYSSTCVQLRYKYNIIHYLKNNLYRYTKKGTRVRTNIIQHYLKNNLKYKHSAGATGTLAS